MTLTPGDTEPSQQRGGAFSGSVQAPVNSSANQVTFDRRELDRILNLYGRMVADGEWRDYAIDSMREQAVFSIFRRGLAKCPDLPHRRSMPKLARRQGCLSPSSRRPA